MRAMLLAAGLGTRLRPLTDELPKPLLPVANRPQIHYVLDLLARAGVREVVVNLHHLGGRVRAALGDSYGGALHISYSPEPELLGTGGGLKKVERFFADEPFILANADALTDADLRAAVRRHIEAGAAATMLLADWDPSGRYSKIEVGADGMVRRIGGVGGGGGLSPAVFTGIHILSPEIFRRLPTGAPSCIVRDGYLPLLAAGERIAGHRVTGYWRDIGTLAAYLDANAEVLRGALPGALRVSADGDPLPRRFPGARFSPPALVGPGCTIEAGSVIGPAVVLGEGCRVGAGSRLEEVVALPGARFGPGETARRVVRSPAVSVLA